MASVTSLGTYRPPALQYLIDESILTSNHSVSDYKWDIYKDFAEKNHEEEIITTNHCVVWLQGGAIKRTFRFEVEGERVQQAILTWLPSDENPEQFSTKKDEISFSAAVSSKNTWLGFDPLRRPEQEHPKHSEETLSRALIIILGRQAHINYSSGISHVIRIPFEIDAVFPAPKGIVLQRKAPSLFPAPPTPMPPPAPPTSFWSSQTPNSSSSEFESAKNISIYAKPSNSHQNAAVDLDKWQFNFAIKRLESYSILYTLTDPVKEIGVVAASPNSSVATTKNSLLATDEELLYISRSNEVPSYWNCSSKPLFLGLTLQKDQQHYTLWQVAYTDSKADFGIANRRYNGITSRSRRRSSYTLRASTGATTPAARAPENLSTRENYAGLPHFHQSLAQNKTDRVMDTSTVADVGNELASQLQDDIAMPGYASASDRRTSSWIARSELSTQESTFFPDLSRNQTVGQTSFTTTSRKSQIFGQQAERTSFGRSGRLSSRLSSAGSLADDVMQDIIEDEPLEDTFEDDFPSNLGIRASPEGLKTEMVMARIMSIPIQMSTQPFSESRLLARDRIRVFVHAESGFSAGMKSQGRIVLSIMDYESNVLQELLLNIRLSESHNLLNARRRSTWIVEQSIQTSNRRTEHVLDANSVSDGTLSGSVLLVHDKTGTASLSLSSPWTDVTIDLEQLLDLGEHFRGKSSQSMKVNIDNSNHPFWRVQQIGSNGLLDFVDRTGDHYRIQIRMQPRDHYVFKILDACIYACFGIGVGGDIIFPLWWGITNSRHSKISEPEWHGMVITIFSIVLSLIGLSNERKFNPEPQNTTSSPRTQRLGEGLLINMSRQNAFKNVQYMRYQQTKASVIMDDVYLAAQVVNEPAKTPAFANWIRSISTTKHKNRWLAACRLICALHLLREDAKLDTMSREVACGALQGLAPVLAQIGYWMNWDSWSWLRGSFYFNEIPDIENLVFDSSRAAEVTTTRPPFEPASIFTFLLIDKKSEHEKFQTLADLYHDNVAKDFHPLSTPKLSKNISFPIDGLLPRISAIITLTEDLVNTALSQVKIVENMIYQKLEPYILETLPEGVVASLRAAMMMCQYSPPTTWPEAALKFVDRQDLDKVLMEQGQPKDSSDTEGILIEPPYHDVRNICLVTTAPRKAIIGEGIDLLSRLVFREDKRLDEASKLLNPTRPAVAHLHPAGFDTEAQFLEKQKEVAQATYMRTMSLPSGKGILEFGTRQPALTDKLVTTGFTTSTVIFPSGNTVNADKSNFTEEKVCWAWFHAGVEAGLSVPRSASGLDTSWFVLNKPEELGNRHAGLLLALGLNGHFKSMAKWLAFKYLTEKHNMTTVALLIGLSASFLGTMDTLITKILSVHVQCLLPQGSADVNLSSLTQTAGVMGIGLLYYNTQHRRMSEVMLGEIEHLETEESSSSQDITFRNEGYRLAAGLALGFINLGKGKQLRGLHDMRVVERLLSVATGPRENPRVHVFDQATAGAIMAITLIFMKSNDDILARRIDAPATVEQFDYLRPDMLLLRKLAAKMIMWESILPTFNFLRNEMPIEYQNTEKLSLRSIGAFRTEDLPFFNILAALLWSIGLKFAGTGNIEARNLLIQYLDEVHRLMISQLKPDQRTTWNEDFALTVITRFEHLAAISSSVIMAGSGDLEVFRRLRRIHGFINKRYTFGCHQALHQAIGILFLGKGRYTFCTSNIATASLLCSFYPLFPQDVLDNQAHLQALRHLWVFAAEARCLVPRDVETNHPLVSPITVALRNGTIMEEVKAPCLLPELHTIASITTSDPNYMVVRLDFENNTKHLEGFERHQSIWLRSKSRYQSANSDPFSATLEMIEDASSEDDRKPVLTDWIYELPAIKASGVSKAELRGIMPAKSEKENMLGANFSNEPISSLRVQTILNAKITAIDDFLTLLKSVDLDNKDRLMGLRVLFAQAEWLEKRGERLEWIDKQKVLKLKIELMRRIAREVEELKGTGRIQYNMEVD